MAYSQFFRLKFLGKGLKCLVIRLKVKVGFNDDEDDNDNFFLGCARKFFLSKGCNYK